MNSVKLDNKYLLTKIPEFEGIPNKELATSMMEFVRRKKALGLAANQVGHNYRLFVMDVTVPRRCFNPKIISYLGSINMEYKEGCLSYPNIFLLKPRALSISVSYTNQNNKLVVTTLTNLEAICFQHELDHLNGINWN